MERVQNPSPRPHEAKLIYRIGDATNPSERPAIILHVVNDQGVWAKGFVAALSKKWPGCENIYYQMPKTLGEVSSTEVEPGVFLLNACAQRGVSEDRVLSLLHLEECFCKLCDAMDRWPGTRPTIHTIRMGQGMGNRSAEWPEVEQALILGFGGHTVYVYDLTEEDYQSYQPEPPKAREYHPPQIPERDS